MDSEKQLKRGIKPIDWKERIGYGSGAFGYNIIFTMVGAYLTIYLTNVAFLDIAVISTIIAVSKVFDGISDIIVGNIIDNTSTAYGKARVWFLRLSIPFAVSVILLFWVPPQLPQIGKYVYVFLMYNLVSTVFFTFMQISHFSLISLLSGERDEQGLLGNIQSVFRNLALLAGNAVFVKLLMVFTDDPSNENTQRAYTFTVLIYSVVMVLLLMICFFTTNERVSNDNNREGKDRIRTEAGKKSFIDEAKVILTNKYWLIMIISQLFAYIGVQLSMSGSAYYALYVLNDMSNVSWIMASTLAPSLVIQFITPFLMKKFGKRNVLITGFALCALGGFGFGLLSPSKPGMILFGAVKGLGTGMYNSMLLGIIADIINYTKVRTGHLVAGVGNAGVSAANKLGQGLGNVVLGFSMSMAGFDAALKTQPAAVSAAVSAGFVWIPAIIFACISLVFLLFFDIDKHLTAQSEDAKEE